MDSFEIYEVEMEQQELLEQQEGIEAFGMGHSSDYWQDKMETAIENGDKSGYKFAKERYAETKVEEELKKVKT